MPALMSVTESPRLISLFSNPPAPRRIFIFADPELLSEAICNALVTDTKAAQISRSPRACMCYVIIHAMQAALGQGCDVSTLKASLQVTGSASAVPRAVSQWSCSCRAPWRRGKLFGKWTTPTLPSSSPHCWSPSPVVPVLLTRLGYEQSTSHILQI